MWQQQGKSTFFILYLFLCVTQFICSWDTWVAMCGSISHLIVFDLFGLSHRTRFLLKTTTKQQNKSCFAKVVAKAVEGTPFQRERIRQTCFGSISASSRERSFQDQKKYRLGKRLKPSQQHKWSLRNRKAHSHSGIWRASVEFISKKFSEQMQNQHCGRT